MGVDSLFTRRGYLSLEVRLRVAARTADRANAAIIGDEGLRPCTPTDLAAAAARSRACGRSFRWRRSSVPQEKVSAMFKLWRCKR